MRHECVDCDCDPESNRHWKKEWLYNRNHSVRFEAERQHELAKKGLIKVDTNPRFVKNNPFQRFYMRLRPSLRKVCHLMYAFYLLL